MNIFDVIIIGGGPGGYHAGHLAGKSGLHTLVIEKDKLGGVCLNRGCIPSKALLNSAKHYNFIKNGSTYGIHSKNTTYNQKEVIERKNQVVKTLVTGVAHSLRSAKVTVVTGEAKIEGKTEQGFRVKIEETEYIGKQLIIATGSVPVLPPITGLDKAIQSGTLLTSKEILDLTEIPDNLTIIGGGVIGLEMATYFAQVGSNVTVIEMLSSIGGPIDSDISTSLKKILEDQGVTFKLNAKVTKIDSNQITYVENDEEHTISHDYALLSVGRKANTSNLGLETIHVEVRKDGSVITDEQTNTNIANVFAIGDVNGKVLLAHTAYKEAEVCVNNLTGKKDRINYDIIPSVIYTSPEVCSIGFTQKEAVEKGYDVRIVQLPVAYSGRHLAESNNEEGFIKLVVNNKKNTLIGAHMLSLYASEIALFLGSMMHLEINIDEMKRIIYPHPTVGELVKEALFQI